MDQVLSSHVCSVYWSLPLLILISDLLTASGHHGLCYIAADPADLFALHVYLCCSSVSSLQIVKDISRKIPFTFTHISDFILGQLVVRAVFQIKL